MFGRWGFLGFFGGEKRESKSWCGKSAELIMHVCFITPRLGLFLILGLRVLLDVGGHVLIGPVDPLKVNLKGGIRLHF